MTQRNIPSKRSSFKLKHGNKTLSLGKRTLIMGVVNVTPDSFSHDGCLETKTTPIRYAKRLIREGADILDIGGESSRPGAKPVSVKEELKRVIPAITQLAKQTTTPISIDTYKPEVAQAALDAGATIVNNIMGTKLNKKLLKMVHNYDAAICLMHIKGIPRTMQKNTTYKDLIADIFASLKKSKEICLENGVKSDRIILDPGIGFGKSPEHNLVILNRLKQFKTLKAPLLIGTSRKSFIGKVLGHEVNKRLYGTLASVSAAIMNGAHIVRVHDIKEALDTVRICDAVLNEEVENA